jgi:hypothetical protein
MTHHLLRITGSLVALGVLIGCDQTSSVSPSSGSSAAGPTVEAQLVPWKESYQASGTLAPDGSCPASQLLNVLEGGGTATHVGKYTIVNSHCVDPATGALTNGSFIKTAANGDQLYGTYVGNSSVIQPPAPIAIFGVTGTLTYTGGTGRFAGTTGTATMEGTLTADFSQQPISATSTLRMVGEISSPGQN